MEYKLGLLNDGVEVTPPDSPYKVLWSHIYMKGVSKRTLKNKSVASIKVYDIRTRIAIAIYIYIFISLAEHYC